MPSDALIAWQTVRLPRLHDFESDCLHLQSLHPANPDRVQDHIRSYVILLSSEFQDYCRDLHTECTDRLVDAVHPIALHAVLRNECVYGRKLDTGNPNPGTLGADFNRYLIDFWSEILARDAANHPARRDRPSLLNVWRNAIAHHNYDPAQLGGTTMLTIAPVQLWRTDCDILASVFDDVMRNHLQTILGQSPWPP